MSGSLTPLKFTPLVKSAPWGGRKLESLYAKALPPDVPCGESWELVDLPQDQSIVSEGDLASASLESLVHHRPEDLLGEVALLDGRFPVLFKLIDAQQTLSVQVHPDLEACGRLGQGARPKAEAWYILQAEPGALLYLGLKTGVSPEQLSAALESGQLEELLFAVPVKAGEFYYLPAGCLHAIGAGIVLAEIQQSSDTTYRVFDWNRVGLDGQPRTLHLEQALSSIDFQMRGQIRAAAPLSGRPGVRCEFFSMERARLSLGDQVPLPAGRPRLVACIEGRGELSEPRAEGLVLDCGQTCLLPACCAGQLSTPGAGSFLLIHV